MTSIFSYGVRRFIDWFFRVRAPWAICLQAGAVLVVASVSGFVLVIRPGEDGGWLSLDTGSGTPEYLTLGCFLVGVLLIAVGIGLRIWQYRLEQADAARRLVIVIEQMGLQRKIDSRLADAVPASIVGRREALLIDHTHLFESGTVVDPGRLVQDVLHIRRDVSLRAAGVAAEDVSLVYGGLAPVAVMFLAGALLDDEGRITMMDWDRSTESWRLLDGDDDGDRFGPPDLSGVAEGAPEVRLAVSVSYRADLPGLARIPGVAPVVDLSLQTPLVGNHWSQAKQDALTASFVETMVGLANRRVGRVLLALAAPASVVFRFGRAYDRRNMPEVVVLQHERSQPNPFPWGVRMPSHADPAPAVEYMPSSGP